MVEIMKRTRAEQKLDDDEAVRGNLRDMGPWGALQFVIDQLASGTQPSQHKRRMLILTGRAASKLVRKQLTVASKLMKG
jgi:hypothetical protein